LQNKKTSAMYTKDASDLLPLPLVFLTAFLMPFVPTGACGYRHVLLLFGGVFRAFDMRGAPTNRSLGS
jgi:hypothetical protein